MTILAGVHHVVERLRTWCCIELCDGLSVQRGVVLKMVVDHRLVCGVSVEQAVPIQRLPFPGKPFLVHVVEDARQLVVHGDHGAGQFRHAVGLTWSQQRGRVRRLRF